MKLFFMNQKEQFVLIVAGGSGSRMKYSIPKQFIPIGNMPILMHTIAAFYQSNKNIHITVVLPGDHIQYWEDLCKKFNFTIVHNLVKGGDTRGASVINGLNSLPGEGLVAIHDGVRPFVSKEIISNSFDIAGKHGSAVAVVDLKDSIRKVDLSENKAVDRTNYKIVQTPQTFKIPLIKESYRKADLLTFTDDATVAEAAGNKIELIKGSYDNIKVTTPEDLIVAQEILNRLQNKLQP